MVDWNGPRARFLLNWRVQIAAAVVFAALAFLLDGCHGAKLAALNLEPVELQLPLGAGTLGPTQFRVGYSGVYELEVAIDGLEGDKAYRAAECRLGISLHPETDCVAISPALNITWLLEQRVTSNGGSASVRTVMKGTASGHARGGSWSRGDTIARRLTTFRAQRGDVYSVTIDSRSTFAAVDRLRPRVRIRTTAMENENLIGQYLAYSLGVLLAGALGAVAFLLAVVGWYQGDHRRR